VGNRKLTIKPGVEINLSYPDDITSTALENIIPPVIRAAANILAKSGSHIVSAFVEAYTVTEAKVVFYREYGKVMREEIIPVAAKAKAFQDGRNVLKNLGLDEDILRDAQDDLNRKRKK
jgi:hypothetical protein